MRRRDALQLLAGGAASLALRPTWAAAATRPDDFFLFIHAGGGWDVTLWADPRNERKGLIEPASPANTDTGGLAHWKPAGGSFEVVTPPGSSLRLGPAIGKLFDLRDRLTIVNGLAMNTVSHDDGTTFSTTGRHRSGGAAVAASIDVMLASELGAAQLMPDIAVRWPASYLGGQLDRRSVPLRVGSVDAITKSFERSAEVLGTADRDAITALVTDEARALAGREAHAPALDQLASQLQGLPPLIGGDFTKAFSPRQLQAAYPEFDYRGLHRNNVVAAPFAIEAFRRNIARCVGFGLGGFDTHTTNQRQHARLLQELFDVIAAIVHRLDTTPHPTRQGTRLAERTHILVVSEFCRTPQINPGGGRDHYPNNSALIISPRLRPGVHGKTDPEQLLPVAVRRFADGERPIAPPDLLATYVAAFGIDPRRHLRDGEVVRELLA
ncbi:MAG TPA: DUF1501 domain-containing protein [Kofleriaceae bacterium]|jgi:hypothetical protein|nr:DUF1501 domain-containing protein [Kofleriaceae bacterium]